MNNPKNDPNRKSTGSQTHHNHRSKNEVLEFSVAENTSHKNQGARVQQKTSVWLVREVKTGEVWQNGWGLAVLPASGRRTLMFFSFTGLQILWIFLDSKFTSERHIRSISASVAQKIGLLGKSFSLWGSRCLIEMLQFFYPSLFGVLLPWGTRDHFVGKKIWSRWAGLQECFSSPQCTVRWETWQTALPKGESCVSHCASLKKSASLFRYVCHQCGIAAH